MDESVECVDVCACWAMSKSRVCGAQATVADVFGTATVDAIRATLLGTPTTSAFIDAFATNPTVVSLTQDLGAFSNALSPLEVAILVSR